MKPKYLHINQLGDTATYILDLNKVYVFKWGDKFYLSMYENKDFEICISESTYNAVIFNQKRDID